MTEVCEIIDGDRGINYPTTDEFTDEVLIPDIEIQEQFADFAYQVDKSKVVVPKVLRRKPMVIRLSFREK